MVKGEGVDLGAGDCIGAAGVTGLGFIIAANIDGFFVGAAGVAATELAAGVAGVAPAVLQLIRLWVVESWQ